MTKLREQMIRATRYLHLVEPAHHAARACPDLLDFSTDASK